ncbi:3,4-dihydroxy-2-butanone-4-phosphate synthase [Nocardia sp. CA-135953]|uniref:3,4-dihydroxy-2-butanone-4-phosphate synthase n=1 Tax=Nocardia sp. CA-135953 TaxID=3239978 RepID=UPI003D957F04
MRIEFAQQRSLDTVETALAALAGGGMVVVVDDEDRENAGDLVRAAALAMPEAIAFMVRHTSGVLCAPRYSLVRDPLPAPGLIYELKPDSSASWLAMLVTGSGNPIQRVALRSGMGGPWQELDRGMDNYWTISGAGSGPFSAQVTDIHGHQAEITGISLEQGQRYTGMSLYTEPAPKPPPARAPEITDTTPQPPSSVASTGCAS